MSWLCSQEGLTSDLRHPTPGPHPELANTPEQAGKVGRTPPPPCPCWGPPRLRDGDVCAQEQGALFPACARGSLQAGEGAGRLLPALSCPRGAHRLGRRRGAPSSLSSAFPAPLGPLLPSSGCGALWSSSLACASRGPGLLTWGGPNCQASSGPRAPQPAWRTLS